MGPAGGDRERPREMRRGRRSVSQNPDGCVSVLTCLPAEARREAALRHVSPACTRVSDEWICRAS